MGQAEDLSPEGVSGPGVTVDGVRRQNLAQVLSLVHRFGSLRRAELTRATGLNRSTIAALVTDLLRRGLIEQEFDEPTRRVGRPSPVVLASRQTVALAINPEIDATDIAVVSLGGQVLHRVRHQNERIPTVTEFVNTVSAVIAGMRYELDANYRVLGIGVAIPGLVRTADGFVLLAPHLGWRDVPVVDLLAQATGFPTFAANDAKCGVIAESLFGRSQGSGLVVYLNGGASGIGGGIADRGALFSGASGHAGELGHTLVESNGVLCHCGASGCFETEVSRSRLLHAVGLSELDVDELAEALDRAWRDPASLGRVELERQLRYLGVALRNICNTLNPIRVVLGGFLADILKATGEQELFRAVGDTLPGGITDVRVSPAQLRDSNLLIGAAELVFAPVLADPTLVGVILTDAL